MKTLIIAVLTMFTLTATAQKSQELNIGKPIPEPRRAMKSVDGRMVTLMEEKGPQGLLVIFSCNTCPFVLRNQQLTAKVINYAKERRIGVVIINSNEAKRGDDDSFEAMTKYAKAQNYTAPYVADEKAVMADAFGATHTPEIYLFNGDGKLVYKGAMSDNPGEPAASKSMFIIDAINAIMDGKKPDPSVTKSVGCSIKR